MASFRSRHAFHFPKEKAESVVHLLSYLQEYGKCRTRTMNGPAIVGIIRERKLVREWAREGSGPNWHRNKKSEERKNGLLNGDSGGGKERKSIRKQTAHKFHGEKKKKKVPLQFSPYLKINWLFPFCSFLDSFGKSQAPGCPFFVSAL